MKKLILLTMLPFYVLAAMAQDMLVTNEGKSMTIYNLEISAQSIFFQLSNKADAPLQKMLKKDVLIIKKADGTKLDLNAPQAEETNQVVQPAEQKESGIVYVTPETLSPEAKAANDALIAKYNQPVKLQILKEKRIGKNARSALAIFGIKENSVLSNEDIEINITTGGIAYSKKKGSKFDIAYKNAIGYHPALQFSVKNKTNRTIYLDLGNTFYISMGQSICFYTPSSTTTTSSSSSGASVNLGAIAGALGVGGVAGTLANGVNVGGGATNGTTNTVYAQRVIPIAPMGTVTLDAQYMFGKEDKLICKGLTYSSYLAIPYVHFVKSSPILIGDHYSYNKNSSPVNLSFIISYSKSEDCQKLKTQSANFFLKDLCGYYEEKDVTTNHDLNVSFETLPINNNGIPFPKP